MGKPAAGAGVPLPDRVAGGGVKAPKKPAKSTQRGRERASHVDPRGRETRAQETSNELFERVDESKAWERPASLAAPPERAGFKQRWIRIGFEGGIDEKNLSRKLKEGWRARHTDTIPKSFHVPRVKHGRFAGAVIVEGMLLCEMPERLAKSRASVIRGKINEQTDAIDEQLRQANAGSRAGGFGPIKRAQVTKPAYEVKTGKEKAAEEAEEVEL